MVALALIDWLVTKAGAVTRRKQKIVIMPNVNPDGAERDIYTTPAGIRPNSDHSAGGAKTPEGIAVEKVAHRLAPEVFVDVHARGGAGCSYDMVLYPATRLYTEDEYVVRRIADDMVAAGERTGIPHVTHTLIWWGGGKPDNTSTTRFCYCTFKSIVMLTENAEHNDFAYPPAARIRSGLARLKALLAWGNRRYSKLYYEGYPFQLAMGMFHRGIVAVGKTAAARRRSRLGIWQNADAFKAIGVELPEQALHKKMFVEYEGPPLPAGAGLQLRARGRLRPLQVRLNGRKLPASPINGYCWWRDHCSTFVMAAARKLQPGKHELVIDFAKSRASCR